MLLCVIIELSDSSSQVRQYCEVIIKLPSAVICYFDMLAVENFLVSKAVYYLSDVISCKCKFSIFFRTTSDAQICL